MLNLLQRHTSQTEHITDLDLSVLASYPVSAGSGDAGPEETSPVGVLKDEGEDASEQPGAVDDDVTLSVRAAGGTSALDQPLHRLQTKKQG